MAFDVGRDTTFRREIFPGYKAQRKPHPVDLSLQVCVSEFSKKNVKKRTRRKTWGEVRKREGGSIKRMGKMWARWEKEVREKREKIERKVVNIREENTRM